VMKMQENVSETMTQARTISVWVSVWPETEIDRSMSIVVFSGRVYKYCIFRA